MVVLTAKDRCIGLQIKKKLGSHNTYGYCEYGGFIYGHGYKVHGIYQVRHRYKRITPIIMKFYKPTNPQTVPQQTNRTKFANACIAWNALTDSQKLVYKERAKRLKIYGSSLFIREYMLTP